MTGPAPLWRGFFESGRLRRPHVSHKGYSAAFVVVLKTSSRPAQFPLSSPSTANANFEKVFKKQKAEQTIQLKNLIGDLSLAVLLVVIVLIINYTTSFR
jgi:hypothetical protein